MTFDRQLRASEKRAVAVYANGVIISKSMYSVYRSKRFLSQSVEEECGGPGVQEKLA